MSSVDVDQEEFRIGEEKRPSGLVVVKGRPFNAEAPVAALDAPITDTRSFYVRSHFDVPRIDPATHRISIEGEVNAPFSLTMEELAALPRRTYVATMECAGNGRLGLSPLPPGEPWGNGAISTAEWAGVPLREVLQRAGLREGTVEVLAEGADAGEVAGADVPIAFARSLPLEVALHEDTLLALEMNDEPLSPEHGAPVRLLVPRWFGVASVKWVRRLVALKTPYQGHFQTEKYVYDAGDGRREPVQRMKVSSLLTSPRDGEVLPRGEALELRGRAWSGSAPVVKVEVAVDGGERWQEAELEGEPSAYAWRGFRLSLRALEPGRHTLRCRATDAQGNTQPAQAGWNKHGYGNNAVRRITISVE
ncbi:MAG TPA: sulfite oxidase [Myxococcaceae bacterium]|nr:sulfite oxidase [Myxococcaceae bacterium]